MAATASASFSGSLTGSEQRSPTQTNAAGPRAAASVARAGCEGVSAPADGARSTTRSRNGSSSAAAEGAIEMGAVRGRLEQRERRANHGGKIRREAGDGELPLAPGMAEPVAARHLAGDEVERARRKRDPSRLLEQDARIDQRSDHQ